MAANLSCQVHCVLKKLIWKQDLQKQLHKGLEDKQNVGRAQSDLQMYSKPHSSDIKGRYLYGQVVWIGVLQGEWLWQEKQISSQCWINRLFKYDEYPLHRRTNEPPWASRWTLPKEIETPFVASSWDCAVALSAIQILVAKEKKCLTGISSLNQELWAEWQSPKEQQVFVIRGFQCGSGLKTCKCKKKVPYDIRLALNALVGCSLCMLAGCDWWRASWSAWKQKW